MELVPLKGTTTGADILRAVLPCLEENKLDLEKLVSVTTDGAPAMVGVRKGFVSLLEKHIKEAGFQNQVIKIHCIIHQEALCAKYLEIKEVMNVVVKVVNLILSKGLKPIHSIQICCTFVKFVGSVEARCWKGSLNC